MSDNWLGFSLTPHLKIDHHHHHHHHHHQGFGSDDQDHHQQQEGAAATAAFSSHSNNISLMPLRSDGSLCVLEYPFRPSSTSSQDWRYDNTMEGTSASEEGPKLEDFLGCYTNSPSNEDQSSQNQNPVVSNVGINVHVSPTSFNVNGEHNFHSFQKNESTQTLIPSTANPTGHNNGGMHHHVPFESASSVSGFKSWLRQTPFYSEKSPNEASNYNFQSLSLAMSPSSQDRIAAISSSLQIVEYSPKRLVGKSLANKEPVPRKSIDTFGQRTSQYRGVTRHRWTGRYEAHLWDNSCRKEGQTRKGRQVYLGGYDKEEKAARAYDLAALKYWGPTTHTNFPLSTYEKELEEMKHMSRQEFVANLRRKSSGFSRGASMYRGVTRHHQHGRWQARIGRVAGNKDLYLGTFSTQEEAAEAYDIAAIKFRGTSAVTNFGISRYDVKRICSSSTLIAGDLAKRSPKESAPLGASSTLSQPPLLAITNGDASDELADVVWSANTDQDGKVSTNNNEVTLVGSVSRTSPSLVSPIGLAMHESSNNGGDFSQGYSFSLQGEKYDNGDNGSNNRVQILGLDNQVPMFALWNEQLQ